MRNTGGGEKSVTVFWGRKTKRICGPGKKLESGGSEGAYGVSVTRTGEAAWVKIREALGTWDGMCGVSEVRTLG